MEAARLLDQGIFDLVVTDGFSRLPGAAFITTGDLVRSASPTPVALFSAHTHDPDVAKAAGFRDLITKPFDPDTLVHQVKVLLDRSEVPLVAIDLRQVRLQQWPEQTWLPRSSSRSPLR